MIDYINCYLKDYIDFVIDDQKEKQGLFLPGCNKQILSLQEVSQMHNKHKPLGILLGIYKENEHKVIPKCKAAFAGSELAYFPLYTPSFLNMGDRDLPSGALHMEVRI